MPLPAPEPGLVLRYDFLWHDDAARGTNDGKDRPVCLVATSAPSIEPRFVVLLPITHTPPSGDVIGIEIPHKVKLSLGLDDEPSWVIVSEHNVDTWPNGGLSTIPGHPGTYAYGFIPPGLFAQIRTRFVELARQRRSTTIRR
jgi:hypothetical protein